SVLGPSLQCLPVVRFGLFQPARLVEQTPEVHVRVGMIGRERQRAAIGIERLIDVARLEVATEPIPVVGVQVLGLIAGFLRGAARGTSGATPPAPPPASGPSPACPDSGSHAVLPSRPTT